MVAGHICLDIIPKFFGDARFEPGHLVEVGAAEFSTGGCVANVGRALHRLDVPVRLIARIGSDPFGKILHGILTEDSPDLSDGILIGDSNSTSYSIVISPPGVDRTFLHMPGENEAFVAGDVAGHHLESARHFHFGYPPLMKRMFENEGEQLEHLFRTARDHGCSTSLDLSYPDPESAAGRADWTTILSRVLPLVDFFFPSNDELAFMTGIPATAPEELATWCLDRGCAAAIVKCGEAGLVAKTSSLARINQVTMLKDANHWANQALNIPCLPVSVQGTTGAGDATIAGFLAGLVRELDFSECLRAGTAVGAMCVERPDAISGIPTWGEIQNSLATHSVKVVENPILFN